MGKGIYYVSVFKIKAQPWGGRGSLLFVCLKWVSKKFWKVLCNVLYFFN